MQYRNPRLYSTEECKDIKQRILVESIGEYTETHNIAYGIVAYSFVSRYSCPIRRYGVGYSVADITCFEISARHQARSGPARPYDAVTGANPLP